MKGEAAPFLTNRPPPIPTRPRAIIIVCLTTQHEPSLLRALDRTTISPK